MDKINNHYKLVPIPETSTPPYTCILSQKIVNGRRRQILRPIGRLDLRCEGERENPIGRHEHHELIAHRKNHIRTTLTCECMWVFSVSWLGSLCYSLCTAKRDMSKKPDLEQVGMEWRRPRLGCAIPPPSPPPPPREADRRRRANAVWLHQRRWGSDFAYERDDRPGEFGLVGGANCNACLIV